MAQYQLNQKEQHYANTREQAEAIVEKAKENAYLTMNKISEKYNKFGTYFLVDLTYTYDTARDIMEYGKGQKDSVPDGQISMDEIDQQEVEQPKEEFDPDSIQFEEEKSQVEATESDLPF